METRGILSIGPSEQSEGIAFTIPKRLKHSNGTLNEIMGRLSNEIKKFTRQRCSRNGIAFCQIHCWRFFKSTADWKPISLSLARALLLAYG